MIVLVTGGSGFVGMDLLRHIASVHPHARLIACDLQPATGDIKDLVKYQALDVRDPLACQHLLREILPTHVIHAAAVTPASGDEGDVSINSAGMCHLLEASVAAGTVRRLLFLSSSGVYDQTGEERPCNEEHPLDLSSAYAFHKRQAELYGLQQGRRIDVVAARLGPVYGPHEHARASRPKVSMIGQLMQALDDGRALRIAGTDMRRDWTYASDASAALEALLLAPELKHRIYNVSGGAAISARTVIASFVARGLEVSWQSDAVGADLFLDPAQSRKPLDITRLKADTGFWPRFRIESGVDAMFAARSGNLQ